MTPRRAAELFHLVFLRALVVRVEDRSLVALKGGCNLRFFFGSIRYSEDIDFDVAVVGKGTLRKKVDGLLLSPLVSAPLKAQAVEIVDVSAPKQTETTQRWKVGLRLLERNELVRTKIEFSRRNALDGAFFEPVRSGVLSDYGLPPFLATHYRAAQAIAQKIRALRDRKLPQARDVFDLQLLLSLRDVAPELTADQKQWLPGAVDRAMSISFDEYRSQVIAYLDPEQAAPFAAREAWELMQSTVVERLEALSV